VLTVVDGRRGEVFVAAYAAEGPLQAPSVLVTPRPVAVDGLDAWLADVAHALPDPPKKPLRDDPEGVGSDDVVAWLAVGDAAPGLRDVLSGGQLRVAPDDSPLHRLSARALCELGRIGQPVSVSDLEPDYCRRPDAEIALEHRQGVAADPPGSSDAPGSANARGSIEAAAGDRAGLALAAGGPR
jgi:tRNA A37 threonylcarbamoyladenosine modification protein TsaB